MNWDQMEGNWEQLKGKVLLSFGKLTDDDFAKIKGRRQLLSGKIQERYGYDREYAEAEIERFMTDSDGSDEASSSDSVNDIRKFSGF